MYLHANNKVLINLDRVDKITVFTDNQGNSRLIAHLGHHSYDETLASGTEDEMKTMLESLADIMEDHEICIPPSR